MQKEKLTHVLVGGLGFVGYHLAVRLLETGVSVVILARHHSIIHRRELFNELADMGVHVRDAGERITKEHIIEANPLTIYHLAGKPGGPFKKQYESHVKLLEVEVEAALQTTARLIYTSSIAVAADIADKPPGDVVVEDDAPPTEDSVFTTIHSQTKAMGEVLLRNSGLKKWSIIRPALIFGPRAPHEEWRILKLLVSLNIAPKIRSVPVVNVKDVAEILYMAGQGGFDGQWVHAVADKINYNDIVREYCSLHGKKRCLRLPADLLIKIGGLAPKTSPLKLSWSILRKGYQYKSSRLRGFPWRLKPVD